MQAAVDIRSYPADIRRHRHDHGQIVLPWRGRMEIEVDGRAGLVSRGCGVFIAAGADHAFSAGRHNAFVVLDLAGPDIRPTCPRPFFPVEPRVEALLDYLTAASRPGTGPAGVPAAWTSLLLDSLSAGFAGAGFAGAGFAGSGFAGSGFAEPAPDRTDAVLRRAEAFMRQHLGRPIRVADMARAAGVSATRLHGMFRDRRGTSPYAELCRIRVAAARDLLAATDRPIVEIALMTGHADQSVLTRRMKALGHRTPAGVRRGRVLRQDSPDLRLD